MINQRNRDSASRDNYIQLCIMPTVASLSRSSVILSRSFFYISGCVSEWGKALTDRTFVAKWMIDVERVWIALLTAPDEINPRMQVFADVVAFKSLMRTSSW